jgi:hypothetical protein
MRDWLSRGDVPVSNGGSYRGVWFTTDSNPDGHGLSGGEAVPSTPEQRQAFKQRTGRDAPEAWTTLDKRAVRIEVVIPSRDRRLFHWLAWTKKRLEPENIAALIASGGGKAKAETWYIYNGTVPPEHFRSVCLRDGHGRFVPATPEQVAALKPLETTGMVGLSR